MEERVRQMIAKKLALRAMQEEVRREEMQFMMELAERAPHCLTINWNTVARDFCNAPLRDVEGAMKREIERREGKR